MSYDKIAQTIPTLLKWNQQYSDEVSNQLYFNIENLLEQYKVVGISRILQKNNGLENEKTGQILFKESLSGEMPMTGLEPAPCCQE